MPRTARHIPFDAEPPLDPGLHVPPPDLRDAPAALWVFGYGSLMWDPGFPHARAVPAMLYGYHRAFCVWSHRYRGTVERPGLVLGLSRGGSCRGRAFLVRRRERAAAIDYLYRREMLTGVYVPRLLRAVLPDGPVTALAFVADTRHRQYAGDLGEARTVEIICTTRGARGPGHDYLANTVRHLDALGIGDGALHRLDRLVRARLARQP